MLQEREKQLQSKQAVNQRELQKQQEREELARAQRLLQEEEQRKQEEARKERERTRQELLRQTEEKARLEGALQCSQPTVFLCSHHSAAEQKRRELEELQERERRESERQAFLQQEMAKGGTPAVAGRGIRRPAQRGF